MPTWKRASTGATCLPRSEKHHLFPEVRATFDRLRALQFTDEEIRELCVQVLATEYYRHVISGVVHDVVRGREFVLIDLRLADGAIPNLLLAVQVINPYGMFITTGAALVVPGPAAWQAVRQLLEEAPVGPVGDAFDDADLAGPLITSLKRLLIAHGALAE